MELSLTDMIGAPFKWGGRDLITGLDCQGLFLLVMRRIGLDVKETDLADYAVETVAAAIQGAASSGRWIPIEKPEAGAAVVLATHPEAPDLGQHLAVCINEKEFIHASDPTGVHVSRLDDRFYRRKIRGFYRWTG